MPAKTYPDQAPDYAGAGATLSPPAFCHQPRGLSDGPMQIRCPSCREMVMTRVEYVTGLFTWFSCLGIAIDICFWCLVCCLSCVPFCLKAFKNVEHYCPRCNIHIGTRKLM